MVEVVKVKQPRTLTEVMVPRSNVLREVVSSLLREVAELAQLGTMTPCACGYKEWALDLGGVTYLYNSNGELPAFEVQVDGVPILHGHSYGDHLAIRMCESEVVLSWSLDWESVDKEYLPYWDFLAFVDKRYKQSAVPW